MCRSNGETTNSERHLSEGVVKAIFLLLGVGILIPWNAFVSAKPYFQARLCSDEGQDIVDSELWFGLVWNLSSVFSLGLIIVGQCIYDSCKKRYHSASAPEMVPAIEQQQHQQQQQQQVTDNDSDGPGEGAHDGDHSFWLVMVPLALYMAVFVATDLLVLIPNMEPQTFLVVTLVGLGVCGTCGAIATAGIVSTAGLFPSHIGINPFFSGQALGGVAVAVANFFAASMEDPTSFWDQNCHDTNNNNETVAINERIELRFLSSGGEAECTPYSDYDWAVFGYFLAGCVVLGCCLWGYSTVHKYKEVEHRDSYEVVRDNVQENGEEPSPRIGLELKDRANERREAETDATEEPDSYQHENQPEAIDPLADPTTTEAPAETPILCNSRGSGSLHGRTSVASLEDCYTEEEDEGAVFWAIKGPAACIFLTFTVTLSLFPSWVSRIRSSHECESTLRLANDLYVPFSFVVFNMGDLVGRMLAEKVPVEQIHNMSLKLVLAALCRVVFYPLLLLCVSDDAGGHMLEIENDLYSFLVLFTFAVTNGLLVSCSFMLGPLLLGHTNGLQERGSEMLTFSVFFGLLSGSMLSFPLSELTSHL